MGSNSTRRLAFEPIRAIDINNVYACEDIYTSAVGWICSQTSDPHLFEFGLQRLACDEVELLLLLFVRLRLRQPEPVAQSLIRARSCIFRQALIAGTEWSGWLAAGCSSSLCRWPVRVYRG